MTIKLKPIKDIFSLAFDNYSQDNVDKMSAALAYYTVFSLAPLLIIAMAIVGMVFHGEAATGKIFEEIRGLVGDQAASAVQSLVKSVGEHHTTGVLATVIGVITILFGAGGVFGEIQSSLNQIFKVPSPERSGLRALVRHRFLSFAMVLGVGFLLIVSLLLSAFLAAVTKYAGNILPGTTLVWQLANFFVSLAVISTVFTLMFKILPDKQMNWRHVWMGGAITAVLFSIGKGLIGLYLGTSSVTSYYGAAGSFALILLWVYYTAQILYIGAEFTQAFSSIGTATVSHNQVMTRKSEKNTVSPVTTGARPHVTST